MISPTELRTALLRGSRQAWTALQARLYQKHMLMPDSLLAEGQIPWEAVTSQSVCEVPLRGRQGGGTLRFSPRTGSAGAPVGCSLMIHALAAH